jgi:hypothetical protein
MTDSHPAAQQLQHSTKLLVRHAARMLNLSYLTDGMGHSNNTSLEDGAMNKLFASTALMLAAIAFSAVALGADPAMGTWELNLSKSTFTAGAAPKSQTRVYSQSYDNNVTLLMKVVAADGTQSAVETTYQLDGKYYPVSGTPDYDCLMGRQVSSHFAQFVLNRDGKTVGTTNRRVSKDGKTLTANLKITTANGQEAASTMVFDKQ